MEKKKEKDKRFDNLFGLDVRDMKRLKGICGSDPKKMSSAMFLFNNKQAEGTTKMYARIIKDFKEHCDKSERLTYEDFGETEVGDFVITSKEKKKGGTYFSCIKPALSRLELTRGVKEENSAFTQLIDHLLLGAKRYAGEVAPEVKKMEPVPKEVVKQALLTYIWPFFHDPQQIDLKIFRTLFRWVIMIFTLCRFDGFNHLQAKHFTITADQQAIRILFPKSKTDQFHNGKVSYLPREEGSAFNPVALTALYFKKCGLKFDGVDETTGKLQVHEQRRSSSSARPAQVELWYSITTSEAAVGGHGLRVQELR
jgi:hypothetical protein